MRRPVSLETSERSGPRHWGQSEPTAKAERVRAVNATNAVSGRREEGMARERRESLGKENRNGDLRNFGEWTVESMRAAGGLEKQ